MTMNLYVLVAIGNFDKPSIGKQLGLSPRLDPTVDTLSESRRFRVTSWKHRGPDFDESYKRKLVVNSTTFSFFPFSFICFFLFF